MTDKISSTAARAPLSLVPKKKKTRAEVILNKDVTAWAFDEAQVLRLGGGSAANGDKNDPIVFVGNAELSLRQMAAKYGFSRLPLTYGEFQGFLEYCDRLDISMGTGIVPKAQQGSWSKSGVAIWEQTMPDYKPVAGLFAADDLVALRDYHAKHDVLTKLGKAFDEFSED